MSTEEINVTDDEREFLKSALTGWIGSGSLDGLTTIVGMVLKGWLQPRRGNSRRMFDLYEITDAGRAVARQVGIGGGV